MPRICVMVLLKFIYLSNMWRGTLIYELFQLTNYWRKTISISKNEKLKKEKIFFGKRASQYLMLYSPLEVDPSKPLIIYYHGGGWIFGKPELFSKKAELFTSLGYQVVMPCYRKVPVYTSVQIIEDVEMMMQSLHGLQDEGKIANLDRIILGGVSAGANLVSLLYFRKKMHELANFSQEQFCGIFLFAPPIDLDKMYHTPVLYRYAGARDSQQFRDANPILYLKGSKPIPILCMHGNKDAMVQFASSQSFKESFDLYFPNQLEYHVLQNSTHLDAASWAHTDNDLRKKLVAWMDKVS